MRVAKDLVLMMEVSEAGHPCSNSAFRFVRESPRPPWHKQAEDPRPSPATSVKKCRFENLAQAEWRVCQALKRRSSTVVSSHAELMPPTNSNQQPTNKMGLAEGVPFLF